ncbi:YbaB/EbfC family nucleoid-associated protein [Actinoplanes sp. NPDC051851]|uniref:YbaB/EbfC family nucleoid-associated protein n=1 Tax=Actinoplanes sp. NPDC051851 TaxID=3154753 RepID=UPI003422F79C
MAADTPTPEAEQTRRMEELRTLVSSTAERATSPDHAVTVTAGPRGAVLDIELTSRAARLSAETLGPLIAATARQAAEQARERLDTGLTELGVRNNGVGAALHGELPEIPPLELPPLDEGDTTAPTFALDPGFPSFEGLEQAMGKLTIDAQERWAAYERTREEFTRLTGTGSSAGGAVRATVTQQGLSTVTIDPAALRHGMTQLGRLVLTAVHQADADMAAASAGVAQTAAGPRLDLAAMVREHLPEEFATREER